VPVLGGASSKKVALALARVVMVMPWPGPANALQPQAESAETTCHRPRP
jgi:hypothetical protein